MVSCMDCRPLMVFGVVLGGLGLGLHMGMVSFGLNLVGVLCILGRLCVPSCIPRLWLVELMPS